MAALELAPEVADDLLRILEHLEQHPFEQAPMRVREIMAAIDVLSHSPLIGRPARSGQRELVIGRRSQGYLALYQYLEEMDTVVVLALRSQREAGYGR